MTGNRFELEKYLNRVNFKGDVEASGSALEALHHAHLYAIPFENFDVLLGRGIDLDPKALFHKLVIKRRGGYCFELNGLFLEALKAFGFDARALLGRVHVTGTPTGRGHQIELVRIGSREWILDVGFGGDTPRMPVPLILDEPVTKWGQTVRLTDGGNFGIMLQMKKEEEWADLYSFDLSYVFQGDIEYGNHFNSTHPDIFFTFARVAALPVDNGAITLLDRTLKETKDGRSSVRELEDGPAYLAALGKYFGIDIGAAYEKLPPIVRGT